MSAEARYHYPTNLTDAQWALIEAMIQIAMIAILVRRQA